MKISYARQPDDPSYPFMEGESPFATEFNRRQEALFLKGSIQKVDFEQIATVLLEILVEDYNIRHTTKKKRTHNTSTL